jgi:hypothetical protein
LLRVRGGNAHSIWKIPFVPNIFSVCVCSSDAGPQARNVRLRRWCCAFSSQQHDAYVRCTVKVLHVNPWKLVDTFWAGLWRGMCNSSFS